MSDHLGDALSAMLDGELEPADEEAAGAHLALCPQCRAELASVAKARSWVRSLPPVEPPAAFYQRIPRGAPGIHHRRRAGVVALVGCTAAAALVLGVASPREPSTSPPVGRFVEAHATAVGGGDPVSHLVPAAVPVSFRR
ncbi:MAG: anti-sigma factor family protein [Acidimicrobiales bacterium]